MHSRVAAVKAPRTHNRRRVTGSSGGRREGGESERQRPNMSRHLFYSAVLLLLFVTMICCDSGSAQTEVQQSSYPTSCRVSSPEEFFVWRDKKDDEAVSSLRVPSLVEVNGGLFAVAEAQCTGKDNCGFTGIASELLILTDEKPKELDKSKLKTQVLGNCSSGEVQCPLQTAVLAGTQRVKKVHVSRPTTVVNGSDIYMLAGNYSWAYESKKDSVFQWGPLLVKGNVNNNEEGNGNRIQWKDTYDLPWISSSRERKFLTGLVGGGGSGVNINDDTIVFPVEGTKEDGKAVSLIMYSSDTAGWTVSREMSDDGCSVPSVVGWKGKLMMMTACDDGRRRVYEFALTESWTEALGTLSRVWGNKKGEEAKAVGSGLTTAKIDNRDVLLVTLPVYSKKEKNGNNNGKSVLHLWLTDNTHIVDIGPVSDDEDAAASSLLYRSGGNDDKKELIALYEKKKGGEKETSPGMVSVLLTAQLERVKEVLKTWNEVDKRVSQLCPSENAKEDASTDTACGAVEITDGLVGFLSGKFSDGTWRDEYLGVNARVKGDAAAATGPVDGVTFTGRGAWAEWPVGSQEENQLYHFANYNFTLVATVSIHGLPKDGDNSIPLIGAKVNDGDKNTVLVGLSYNREKRWELLHSGEKTSEHSRTWEQGTTYQVAIVLQNGTQGSVYVDGQRVCESVQSNLENTKSKRISHFFIGGDGGNAENTGGGEGASVTVTNVLLYNRPLSSEEIAGLAKNKINIPTPVAARTSSPAVSRPKRSSESLAGGASGVGTARHFGANGDGSTVCGSGLLPSLLLLLLGLWGFTAL
ncbi:trans-sialidase [Trypanosoma cruzi cruzi]|uniref:Putative trans-sialidase, Group V n=1 Tax=Trypanosoma cruzi TaxID=5693 RepID=A0A2V2VUH3_TRYCR|nr:trans-sialidase [Trypanosoma cruzi cruzi]PWU97973.1 putative trans-sialidase, Group V [Trypanosoma cruzi]